MKNQKKYKQKNRGWFPSDPSLSTSNIKPELSTHKAQPTLYDRLVGGLGAAGGSLLLSAVIFYFVPEYPKQALVFLPIVGIPLLAAAYLMWRKGKHTTQGKNK